MSGDSRRLRSGQVGPLCGEALALIARFTTPPTAARAQLINNLILGLITDQVWTNIAWLYVEAAADSQAAKLEWKGAGPALIETNSPTFVADRGFSSNGTSSYLSTGAPNAIPGFSQNSNGFFAWTNRTTQVIPWGRSTAAGANTLQSTASDTTIRSSITAAGVNAGVVVPTGEHMIGVSRSAPAGFDLSVDGVIVASPASASSTAPPSEAITLHMSGGGYSTAGVPVRASGFGPAISAANMVLIRARLATYMTALGISV